MTDRPDEAVKLISGILGHMRQIVGEGASYAMLHYGAVEEGKRIGSAYGPDDLPLVLTHLDAILRHRSDLLQDDGGTVTVRVDASSFLATGPPAVEGVLVGLLEGCLGASRQARFRGQVVASASPGDVTIQLRREG